MIQILSSAAFSKGIQWLENITAYDDKALREKLSNSKARLNTISNLLSNEKAPQTKYDLISEKVRLEMDIPLMEKKVNLHYTLDDAEAMYILNKASSTIVKEFVNASNKAEFWQDDSCALRDDPHLLWFLHEIGLGNNSYFQEWIDYIVESQSVKGYIQSNTFNHVGSLRVLAATRPTSDSFNNALNYWIENWKEFCDYLLEISLGIITLCEIDYEAYSAIINEQIDYLKSQQNKNGSWGMHPPTKLEENGQFDIETTSYAIWATARAQSSQAKSAQRALKWLSKQQSENGSWRNEYETIPALLGLLAMGEGPKVSLEEIDYEMLKLKQRLRSQKPVFVHTSPLYKDSLHVKEINDKIIKMLHNAKREIRISSPFIDICYEEIINIKQQKPNMIIKIVTRPKGEVGGSRSKIGQSVIDLLNVATKGNILQSSTVHSRLLIIDDSEVLVSSSDLTRDQLYDEFNAGIWTRDKDTIKSAIDFFDNLFDLEKKKASERGNQ